MTEQQREIWKAEQEQEAAEPESPRTRRTFEQAVDNARATGAAWFIWDGNQIFVNAQ